MSDRSTPRVGATGAGKAGVIGLRAALLLCAIPASPAAAASATGHVSVTILPAATVIENTPIRFAGAGRTAASGRVTLRSAGAPDAGSLSLAGAPNTSVTLSFGPGEAVARPNGAISVGAFAHNAGPLPSLNAAGVLNVAVGATLTVPSSQPAGSYSGTYTVIVNY